MELSAADCFGGPRWQRSKLTAGGQSVAQTCRKARQSVAQPPGAGIAIGSSVGHSSDLAVRQPCEGRKAAVVAAEGKETVSANGRGGGRRE